MSEVRPAFRSLARVPIFVVAVVLTVALGVGATTAVFSVVYGVLYRPLPYPDADRLVALWGTRLPDPSAPDQDVEVRAASRIFVANRLLDLWRHEARSFEDLAGFRDSSFTVTGQGEPQRVDGELTTASFFRVLGIRPLLGRAFEDGEDEPGHDEVVVVGYAFWRTYFGGDPAIVGRTVRIDGRPHTVVGVLDSESRLPLQYTGQQPAFYTPMSHEFTPEARFSVLLAVARLKPGVTRAAAQAEMTSVMRHVTETTGRYRGRGVNVASLADEVVETAAGSRQGLLILLAATACVLLIACVNAANLLLVRAASRHRELAVRMALGAGRWRVIGQMVVESVMLSAAGGLAGILIAAWGLDVLLALIPTGLFPRIEEVHVDGAVLAFALAASVVTGLLVSLAPAWYAIGRDRRGVLADALRESHRTATGGHGPRVLRRALVTIEVGVSMVLLVGAGLLARTYAGLMDVELGVRPDHALTFRLVPALDRHATASARVALAEDVLARLRAIDGVRAAGAAESLPIMSWLVEDRMVVGAGSVDERAPMVSLNRVSPGFFDAAGIPLVAGRLFDGREATASVAVASRSAVRRFWPGAAATGSDAVGQTVRIGETVYRIVGVVGDVKYRGPDGKSADVVYLPMPSGSAGRFSIIVRTVGQPMAALPAVRTAVRASDAELPLEDVQTLEGLRDKVVAPQWFRVAIIGCFAGLALLLAVVGLYGMIAQSVVQRTPEIGVRLALGAARGRIVRMVMAEAVLLVIAGVTLGTVASLGAARVLSSVLFGVTTVDGATYGSVAVLLLLVAGAAGLVPARRASAIDPAGALRNE